MSLSEGGYSNHASDSGGETYRGIARNFHPDWQGWPYIDQCRTMANFPKMLDSVEGMDDLVLAFYKGEFWDTWNGDSLADISYAVAAEIFESGVNVGLGRSTKWFQRSCNLLNRQDALFDDLVLDGALGYKSQTALRILTNKHEDTDVVRLLNLFQGWHYIQLTERKESQEDFIRGWVRQRVEVLPPGH